MVEACACSGMRRAACDAACACLVSVAQACGHFRVFRVSQAPATCWPMFVERGSEDKSFGYVKEYNEKTQVYTVELDTGTLEECVELVAIVLGLGHSPSSSQRWLTTRKSLILNASPMSMP